ncbi:MAG: type I 3-dehydroquinate dehydratase [Candidatus Tenebribacter mawsonii]|nr:type I 3-dehydroquinate dehydratase [Candidatus Tenebribacter mawsonii]
MIILSIPFINNDFVIQVAKKYAHYWKEFRLDYSKNFKSIPPEIVDDKTILTIRCREEGGKIEFDFTEKIEYYKKMIHETDCLCDLEIRAINDSNIYSIPANNLILSYHDFSKEIDFVKLEIIIHRMNLLPSKFVKIAVNVSNYSDLIGLKKLISKSNKPVIFAGMGKLGKISRILFNHLGAYSTFIGISDNSTAQGQLTLEEAEFYNLKSISQKTQIGGIIGGNQVKGSLGIKYYNDLFSRNEFNAIYLPFIIDDIEDLWSWIKNADLIFYGFSITMPFKKLIGAKKQLSAVNLFLPKSGFMSNTDLIAFKRSIEILNIKYKDSIIIIGSGATSEIALKAFQAFNNITISSRNEISGKILAKKNKREFIQLELLKNNKFDVIINCTPLGIRDVDIIDLFNLVFPTKAIDLPYKQNNTLLITRCIENEIDYIDGKKFWDLQAKIQQQEFVTAIYDLEE